MAQDHVFMAPTEGLWQKHTGLGMRVTAGRIVSSAS